MRLSPRSDERLVGIALLIGIVVLAAALRFADIGEESYWLDEITLVREVQALDRQPVYLALGYAWARLFGTTEAATRSLSALAGIGSICVVYFVGKELYRRQVGVLAALIMALSVFQIWYSQEFRYLAVLQFVALLAAFFYLMWMRYHYRIDFCAFVVSAVLSAYIHPYVAFLYIGLGLHFLTQWRTATPGKRLLWFASQVAISAVIYSASTSMRGGGTPVVEWVPVPPPYAPLRTLINFVFAQRDYLSWVVIGGAAAVWLIGMVALAFTRRAAWSADARAALRALLRRPDSGTMLLLLWLFTPIVLLFALSLVVAPMYVDRFLIPAAPAWYVLIAALLWSLRRVIPLPLSIGVLLILFAGALNTYYTRSLKEQWRETAAYIQQNIAPGDVVAISYGNFPGDAFNIYNSFSWYYPNVSSECYVDVRSDAVAADLTTCGASGERLWLVVYTANPGGEPLRLERPVGQYTLMKSREFIGTSVYLFDLYP